MIEGGKNYFTVGDTENGPMPRLIKLILHHYPEARFRPSYFDKQEMAYVLETFSTAAPEALRALVAPLEAEILKERRQVWKVKPRTLEEIKTLN
ncbi:MAG: hypothetical protein HY689_04675 [Chloroflexi bacterium]|nr:hypothetical protein [Chloroflexota bacterium]